MRSEAQRLAHRTWAQRLEANGIRAITVRLSQGARDKLAALAKVHGSQSAALEVLLKSADLMDC